MIQSPEVSSLVAVITATLLVLGAATTLVGALGLVRLQSFYQRAHSPTLGTTFGVACVALASMIYFWAGTRPILHEVLNPEYLPLTATDADHTDHPGALHPSAQRVAFQGRTGSGAISRQRNCGSCRKGFLPATHLALLQRCA